MRQSSKLVMVLMLSSVLFGCGNDPAGYSLSTGGTSGAGGVSGTSGTGASVDGSSVCSRADAPSGCGVECTGDSDCSTETFCLEMSCNAFCVEGANDCSSNQQCMRGRCVTMNTGGTSGTGATGGSCPSVDVNVDRVVPNIMLIVDRSGSMSYDFQGRSQNNNQFVAPSRWDALKAGLFDPTTGVLPELDAIARFGLTAYWYTSDNNVSCPSLQAEPIALNNATTIAEFIERHRSWWWYANGPSHHGCAQ
ncbi:MAG: hypothetical protein R3A47_10585 [Polyangiales bacterium]